MSNTVVLYRVLIASPGDVSEERSVVVDEIHKWNDLNSDSRQIVFQPRMWEKNSAPEYNTDPQSVINREVVDDCDLAVCLFWSRLGTPTKDANSGTIEEIDRMGAAGNLIMMYFSEKPIPYEHDSEQLKQVKEFKKKTYKNGLIETFTDITEFREKFRRQFSIKARAFLNLKEEGEKYSAVVSSSYINADGNRTDNITISTEKNTLDEKNEKCWKDTIVDYLFEHSVGIYCDFESMSRNMPDLNDSELTHYLDGLLDDNLVMQVAADSTSEDYEARYMLTPEARKSAISRKNSRKR